MFEDIKEQFKAVISHSQQGIPDPQVDQLFVDWYAAKKPLIDLLGGLIWEQEEPVSLSLDSKERQLKTDNFISYADHLCKNHALVDFLDKNKDSFFTNRVSVSCMNIPQGAKIIKSFKFFEDDDKRLNQLQSRASQIIQENNIEGRLCISVHPLDYLSSSMNTYNWQTCHALDGDFRAGNLSYMVDECTVVCYVKGADNVKIPLFPDSVPWNSKRWRILLHLSKNFKIIWAGKPYPFSSEKGLEIIRRRITGLIYQQNLLTLNPARRYSTFNTPMINAVEDVDIGRARRLTDRYFAIKGELIPSKRMIKQNSGALNYNDLLNSTCYIPRCAVYDNDFSVPAMSIDEEIVTLGGAIKCLRCGEEDVEFPETMMCSDCEINYGNSDSENFTFCSDCHEHIFAGDSVLVEGDRFVCSDCIKNYSYCENCEFLYLEDKLIYDSMYCDCVCSECYDSRREEDNNG